MNKNSKLNLLAAGSVFLASGFNLQAETKIQEKPILFSFWLMTWAGWIVP